MLCVLCAKRKSQGTMRTPKFRGQVPTFSIVACLLMAAQTTNASGPIAEMCMTPDTFLPKNTYRWVCQTTDSDPAVMADCPAGCEGGDYQVADGTTRYYCVCEVSSEAECAAKYPGECPATEDAAHATTSCDPASATHAGISRSPARYPGVHSWREASFEL